MSQKKKHRKIPFKSKPQPKKRPPGSSDPMAECEAAYEALPVEALAMSMSAIVNVLWKRGVRVADWDQKDKSIYKISVIAGRPYVLLTSERK